MVFKRGALAAYTIVSCRPSRRTYPFSQKLATLYAGSQAARASFGFLFGFRNKAADIFWTERPFGNGLASRFEGRAGEDYNSDVARGWESKSVEAQQAEAEEKQARTRPPVTPKEAARCREKENLRLARQRVLQQMAASPNPRHRKLMQDSLADLDQKLKKLTSDLGPQTSHPRPEV